MVERLRMEEELARPTLQSDDQNINDNQQT